MVGIGLSRNKEKSRWCHHTECIGNTICKDKEVSSEKHQRLVGLLRLIGFMMFPILGKPFPLVPIFIYFKEMAFISWLI